MTDNIEKLYELAGIEKEFVCNCSSENLRICKATKEYCSYSKFEYTFTDTKQLELIKWIFFNKHEQYLHFFDVFLSYCHGLKFETKEEKRKFVDSEYPQRLAKLVCELWEDLTPEQREEVRGILQ